MAAIVVHLRRWEQRRLQRTMHKTCDAGLRTRALIIVHAAAGKRSGAIAEAVGYHPSAVLKVIHRFLAEGEEGLRDHRADNGQPKVDEALREALCALVAGSPQDYGWARPTWTQELLARQLTATSRVRVSETTVGRMLAERGIRWGMARPTVACPWSSRAQRRRLRAITRRLASLPSGDEAFYEDEVDIHLNPRIGRDWMGCWMDTGGCCAGGRDSLGEISESGAPRLAGGTDDLPEDGACMYQGSSMNPSIAT